MSATDIVRYARALHARGWVANHDGNVTERLGPNRILATPTALSKADVTERTVLVVNERGERVRGTSRPFSELRLHLAVYAARDDVAAVVHAHPPHATALACANSPLLERPFIADEVVVGVHPGVVGGEAAPVGGGHGNPGRNRFPAVGD